MSADHRNQLNGAVFLASQFGLIILSIPAFVPRPLQVVAFALLGWYLFQVISIQTTGDFNADFGLGSAIIVQYLLALGYAFLTPPEKLKDFQDKCTTSVAERPLGQRVLWTLKLFSNPRGIGWAHEPSYLPPRPSPSTPRSTFVISRILLAAGCFSIVSISHYFVDTYVAFVTADLLVTGAPFRWRVSAVFNFAIGGICMLSGLNATISAAVVGCGFSVPERWPHLFGSPLQIWSIRRVWRRFWHQMIRQVCIYRLMSETVHTDFTCVLQSVLTCTSALLGRVVSDKHIGTTSYKLARLYIAFSISGLVHAGGDLMATGKLGSKSLTFFMLQPLGISVEIVVSRLWSRLQGGPMKSRGKNLVERNSSDKYHGAAEDSIPPLWIRCVGFIWVALWMVWSGAYIVDALYAARLAANFGRV